MSFQIRSFIVFLSLLLLIGSNQDSSLDSKSKQEKPKKEVQESRVSAVPWYSQVASGFQEPTDIQFLPGNPKRMIVLEKRGKLIEVDLSTGLKTIRVDLTGQLETRSEEGLLGLAFSPDFVKSSRFYVNVVVKENGKDYSKILEFEWKTEGVQRIEDARRTILKLEQPYSNHNGGQLAFGPDKKLYIGFGDGGGSGDPFQNGQNPRTLLGSLLRIEPNPQDSGAPYKIPVDNPFVSKPGFLPEIWAYGLRNPWRFSFDSLTGELYLADVGQDEYEEINRIVKGGNYGWNRKEGSHCFKKNPACTSPGMIDPIYEYSHAEGQSITGGYMYRGIDLPQIVGFYIYGDFISGRVWAFNPSGGGTKELNRLLFRVPFQISTFGQDRVGDVYFADFGSGNIFRIIKKKLKDMEK